jgi:hypothetical protein
LPPRFGIDALATGGLGIVSKWWTRRLGLITRLEIRVADIEAIQAETAERICRPSTERPIAV